LTLLLILALVLSPAMPRPPVAQPAFHPRLTAASWIAYDDTFGYEVDAYHADRRAPMASTAKLMTALLVVERADLSDEVVISRRAEATNHKQIWLQQGEIWTVGELLEALMVVSANDAAVALAEHVAGEVSSFVEIMNTRAGELGLDDTAYANPHGLDATGQFTTARDLLALGRQVMAHPSLAGLASRRTAVLVGSDDSVRRFPSTNELLGGFEGAIGVKTGWTSGAGDVLVAAAERDGHRVYAVVMGSGDANADAAALLEFSFAVFGSTERRLLPLMEDRQQADRVQAALSEHTLSRVAHLLAMWKREVPGWQ
jgi:D-alanyl-D-alanine carboxypeptidase (penicillin-binding protein 5/6)